MKKSVPSEPQQKIKLLTFTKTKTVILNAAALPKTRKLNQDPNTSDFYFLQNGGEAAELIENIDWESHTLGTPDTWPENLKNTIATIVSSKFPMFLWWGDQLIQFYNDAYRPSFGNEGRHPKAMGQKAVDCWPEIWDFIHPLIQKVLSTGESIWYDDLLLPIFRNGKMEDVYWTFSYSPIRDDRRQIKGVLVICNETTEKVNSRLHLQQSSDELEFAINAAEFGTYDLDPRTRRFSSNARLKDWFGLKADQQVKLEHALGAVAEKDRQRVTESINYALRYESGGRYDIEYTIIHPTTKIPRIVHALGKAWFDNTKTAYRFNGILQDITEHRKAAQELQKSRQLTDLTIQSMGLGLFSVDYAADTLEYSTEFSRILTGNFKPGLGRKDFLKYVHPDDLHLRTGAIKSGIENGTFNYAPRVIWDDGSIHHIAISAARIINSEAKAPIFSGTVADITEKENSRLALEQAQSRLEMTKREADRHFSNVTDSSPTGLWLSNPQGMFTYFNKTLIDFTGVPYQELLEGKWTWVIAEQDYKKTKEAYLKALEQKSHFDVLFRARKNNGQLIWCRAAGDPFYDADGQYGGYAGFCMDIDEIISVRQAVIESQNQLTSMIEQSPVGICLFTGLDMKIEIANDIMIGYWGKDSSVIGLPMEEAVPELRGQPFMDILQQVYRTGETYYGHSVPADLKLDGKISTYYFEFTYTPIRDSKGTIYGVMDIAIDVTDQVIATKKLEETRMALAGAIELAELSTWTLDAETKTITCSDRFKEWLGLSAGTADREDFLQRISEPYRHKVAAALEEALSGSAEQFYDYEFQIVNKITGQQRIIHANAQVQYGKDGVVKSLSGTAQDVTKEKELQQELTFKVKEQTAELQTKNAELEANNRELSQFAYIASHDLQEPIRKISVFTDLLQNNLGKNPEKVNTYIDKISSSSRRMENLIKDVLQFSKLTHISHQFVPVNLNTVLSEIMADFDLVIEQKNAQVSIGQLPLVQAIPLQMSQLFGNLLSNALKYTKPGNRPEISINAQPVPEAQLRLHALDLELPYIKIEVRDNGIGFSQQYAEQIFNIFQRLHGNDQYSGTGIGLAMCRKIMQNHNGEITAASQEGSGTVFTIIMPALREKNGG
ncbi:PAS domain S-box protein [Flavobacterium sp. YJ01]|uniref:PAS domain-containing sensor histidine kinase n=1 Tax=Flavobacterium sp. YJ01 TaxID=3031997 RepID=UPI0023E4110D|nr:PAS domain S-box protein [Flavobacterium sp. YJ01]WET03397.1 PAS domain S-box protein [Flavobacterium sp. YJ01]